MSRGRRRNVKEWTQIIEEQASSGQNAKEFCQSRSIGLASFNQWHRRLQNEEPGGDANTQSARSFVEVGQFTSPAIATQPGVFPLTVTLELGEGFKLTLQRG